MKIDLMNTIKGSMLEGFFPAGWDLERIDKLCSLPPDAVTEPQPWWNPCFRPVPCNTLEDFDVMMGEAIAGNIRNAREAGQEIAFILPVGPMGMYKWAVYFLKQWNIKCDHVHGFNMDEWADGEGNTLPSTSPEAFQFAMEEAFYNPLGELTVPKEQRHFAVKSELPAYKEKILALKAKGAKLVLVFGIGRMCHIAFWEPHFAAEFDTLEEWKNQEYRLGAMLHPLTIEQNAITSFKSRTTLVPACANTIGPGIFLMADEIIGGADGTLGRGMMWQGMSLWMTLRHEPTPWIPSTFIPTLSGRLFFIKELAGPLVPEAN
ncbi:MAG: sugar phosphate isomerase family [Armatimonadota bacterium]